MDEYTRSEMEQMAYETRREIAKERIEVICNELLIDYITEVHRWADYCNLSELDKIELAKECLLYFFEE